MKFKNGKLILNSLSLSVSLISKEAEQIEEEVDEVKVEAEGADSGEMTCVLSRGVLSHLLDFLSIPCGKTDKNEYTGY